MGLRGLILWGITEKSDFSRSSRKDNILRELRKKGVWAVFRFKRGLGKKWGWDYWGKVDTPMHNMLAQHRSLILISWFCKRPCPGVFFLRNINIRDFTLLSRFHLPVVETSSLLSYCSIFMEFCRFETGGIS